MLFLGGVDGAVARGPSPVVARNLLLRKARQQALQVFALVKDLKPAERRGALRIALNAFRPGSAERVEQTAAALAKRGMLPQPALLEGLSREMAATTLTMLTEKGSTGMLQGLADAWLDLRDRVQRDPGIGGLWSGLKKVGRKALKAGGAVLKVAAKVAKGLYNVACSKVGKFAAPAVASAAGSPATGAGVALAQQKACGKKKKKKAKDEPLPAPMPSRMAAPAPAKNNTLLYVGIGGAALLVALLAMRSPTPQQQPVFVRTPAALPPASATA